MNIILEQDIQEQLDEQDPWLEEDSYATYIDSMLELKEEFKLLVNTGANELGEGE